MRLSTPTLIWFHNRIQRAIVERNHHDLVKCACPDCLGIVQTSFPEKGPLCGPCDLGGCGCGEC